MATKLPSGSWRVQVFDGIGADGKRKYTSFTASTEKEADLLALEYQLKKKNAGRPENLTIGEAIDRYIESKDAVLSPSTIREYKRIRKKNLQGIIDVKLNKITPILIQREINAESKTHSPKTVRNIHGLLTAAIKEYYPEMIINTTLPQKEKNYIYLPTEDEINLIIEHIAGTDMEIPVLLSALLGLRRSEICGLMWSDVDIKKKQITIRQAKVLSADEGYKIKDPKTYSGNRKLTIADILIPILSAKKESDGYIIKISPNTITTKFAKILKKLNIQHFRFHDLRHYNASIMLALGIPDKYAMEIMGHATNNMLKTVYQHTMTEEKEKVTDKLNNHFNQIIRKKD